ncbi:type IV secretion system protein VirB5 [Burkholderia latens]|uniref:P-type DNA transfer protein VirB5 n=1 Tax=Burkholderia latens TaxID=488446 RepID=UPI0039A7136A
MKTTLKHAVIAAATFAACAASTGAFAQVPVTITSDAPGLQFHIEDIAKYVAMIDNMKSQVQQLQNTYQSFNGTRGIGDLFNNPQLASMLPSQWQSVYQSVQGGGYSGISGSIQQILSSERTGFNPGTLADGAKSVLDRQFNNAATDKAMGMQAYQAAISRLDNIKGLLGQINQSTDPKAIADLQARIQGEQAAIQNEQTKVQLMSQLQASEDRIAKAQRDELGRRTLNRNNASIPSIGSN